VKTSFIIDRKTEITQEHKHLKKYTAFGMWWHTVTHGRGSEGETGEWSG